MVLRSICRNILSSQSFRLGSPTAARSYGLDLLSNRLLIWEDIPPRRQRGTRQGYNGRYHASEAPNGKQSRPMPTPEPQTFQQLRLLFTDPIQHDYEVIRQVVLFGERVTRAQRGDRP